MKRVIPTLILTFVNAAIVVFIGLTATASAQNLDVQFQVRVIPSGGHAQCLEPDPDVGNQLVAAPCSFFFIGRKGPFPTAVQNWSVLTTSVGMRFINQGAVGLPCMAVHNRLTIPGAPVELQECGPEANETWLLVSTGEPSTFILQNFNSRLCLNLFEGKFAGQDNCDLTSSTQKFLVDGL